MMVRKTHWPVPFQWEINCCQVGRSLKKIELNLIRWWGWELNRTLKEGSTCGFNYACKVLSAHQSQASILTGSRIMPTNYKGAFYCENKFLNPKTDFAFGLRRIVNPKYLHSGRILWIKSKS